MSVDSLNFQFHLVENSEETDDTLNDVKVKLNVKDLGFKVST